ncbi:hypothetical protein PV326_002564 [Microctonus aethiopoides]|nr:hypothetical protein PV326_002564 [Microctonus aethiopoides]
MQDDTFPAAEKILSDIENVIKKDLNLQSFEIIPVNDNENKSPVYHEGNSLGLASWCIQPLYCYTYNRLIELRGNKLRRENPGTASRWLLGAILINPDISTFWNMRRELIRNGRLDSLQELRFTRIVLYHKAKCFEAFAYRRWLIRFIIMENDQSSNINVESLLKNEINIAIMSADRYANNYHAWSHREHVVITYEALLPNSFGELLICEWNSSKKWCCQHVSDHSGVAYRQFLLRRLLLLERQPMESSVTIAPEQFIERRNIIVNYIKSGITEKSNDINCLLDEQSCSNIILHSLHCGMNKNIIIDRPDVDCERVLIALSYWIEECTFNEDLINRFPGHESLWYHYRFLAHALKCLVTSYSKYSCYKAEIFDSRYCVRLLSDNPIHFNEDQINSMSLIEIAFRYRIKNMIECAKESQSDYQKNIVEKFVKFLAVINLQP